MKDIYFQMPICRAGTESSLLLAERDGELDHCSQWSVIHSWHFSHESIVLFESTAPLLLPLPSSGANWIVLVTVVSHFLYFSVWKWWFSNCPFVTGLKLNVTNFWLHNQFLQWYFFFKVNRTNTWLTLRRWRELFVDSVLDVANCHGVALFTARSANVKPHGTSNCSKDNQHWSSNIQNLLPVFLNFQLCSNFFNEQNCFNLNVSLSLKNVCHCLNAVLTLNRNIRLL